ncbi:hypothetical protein WA026_003962 [Henosepilachna vigintioctopunctata]|uniref:Uncharacterized protein n=1 Tax=Henosepilachna vigintioctopunctata TaxID=420089 RepID=A0AAW1UI97_9CUCU
MTSDKICITNTYFASFERQNYAPLLRLPFQQNKDVTGRYSCLYARIILLGLSQVCQHMLPWKLRMHARCLYAHRQMSMEISYSLWEWPDNSQKRHTVNQTGRHVRGPGLTVSLVLSLSEKREYVLCGQEMGRRLHRLLKFPPITFCQCQCQVRNTDSLRFNR